MTAAAVADQVLRLGDGRALGFKVYGDPAGAPLLFLHGTPGSRLKFAIGHDAGKELGLAIVAPDRWGYGLSDAPHAPTLPAFAADMAALMDHLGHARFAVGGISGGGPYAAGVAACLASRVTALALVSPMGPVADPACRRALSHFHRFCFGALPRSPRAIAAVFALFRASLERSPRLAAHLATLRAGARDKALLARPEIARWLLGSFREGLRRGVAGPVWTCSCSRATGVSTSAAIRAPARLWIGTADTAVPLGAARLLARAICRMRPHGAAGGRPFLGGGELRRGAGVGRGDGACRDRDASIVARTPTNPEARHPRASAFRRFAAPASGRRAAPEQIRARPSADRRWSAWLSLRRSSWLSSMASPGRHASLCGCLSGLPSSAGSSDVAMANPRPARRYSGFRYSWH